MTRRAPSARRRRHRAARPVFVDPSGRRLRQARAIGVGIVGAIALYVALVLTVFAGGPRLGSPALPFLGPHTRAEATVPAPEPAAPAPASPAPSGDPVPPAAPEPAIAAAPAAPPAPSTPAPTARPSAAPTPTPAGPGKSATAPGQSKKPTHP